MKELREHKEVLNILYTMHASLAEEKNEENNRDRQVLKTIQFFITFSERIERIESDKLLPEKIPYLDETFQSGIIDYVRINEDRRIRNETIEECKFHLIKNLAGIMPP